MNEERKEMDRALKEAFIPELRNRGFKGSMPHFRRILKDRVDYLTIQFNSAGGGFVVEIAKSGPNGIESGFGSELSVQKLSVQYFGKRLRLGSKPEEGIRDHWFEFGRKSYEGPGPIQPYEHYLGVAKSVVPFLDAQAEAWWNNDC